LYCIQLRTALLPCNILQRNSIQCYYQSPGQRQKTTDGEWHGCVRSLSQANPLITETLSTYTYITTIKAILV